MNRPRSGLQKQVLKLYKSLLSAAKQKDQGGEDRRGSTYSYVRERFRENAESVDRSDFAKIEYLLRKGERDLKMVDRIKSANITSVQHSNKP
uniref:Uncharacterized protein AlNc14C209G8888 n=1 Tax=Albugo laibachii Nc14 TaxID=890382 RepID=F0WR81_9STRA|nr:conserved hypothetical protein [Albugo laibachii Nc14]|eukprot:CCA23842.1 conserved hypothetical protein [Albugo laibachii Nc14]